MKVIVAGSRNLNPSIATIEAALVQANWYPTEVVSGTARGVDRAGELFAESRGIPLTQYPAEWDLHGKTAGFHRNQVMADYADALLAFWDGRSRGTQDMIDRMRRLGKPVSIVRL